MQIKLWVPIIFNRKDFTIHNQYCSNFVYHYCDNCIILDLWFHKLQIIYRATIRTKTATAKNSSKWGSNIVILEDAIMRQKIGIQGRISRTSSIKLSTSRSVVLLHYFNQHFHILLTTCTVHADTLKVNWNNFFGDFFTAKYSLYKVSCCENLIKLNLIKLKVITSDANCSRAMQNKDVIRN